MRQDAIINRQAEAVIVICINHIREVAVVHPRQTAVHHIAVNHHQAVLLRAILLRAILPRAVQAVPVQAAVATIANRIQTIKLLIAVILRKGLQQRRAHIVLMMMAMMISIWMAIMIMTDMTEIAIMQMV